MYRHAAKSVAQPNSSLNEPGVASLSCHPRKEVCSKPSVFRVLAARKTAAVGANFQCLYREDDFGAFGFIRLVSRPLLGVTLRACPAPCGRLALLLPLRGPWVYGFHLRRTLRKCRASALGAGASRWLRQV